MSRAVRPPVAPLAGRDATPDCRRARPGALALARAIGLAGLLATSARPTPLDAQTPAPAPSTSAIHGVVVDQTELPLPGATIRLEDGTRVLATVTSREDGSFDIDAAGGTSLVASLDGFETTTLPRSPAVRIVLGIGRAVETTTVTAPLLAPSSPTAALLGNTLAADALARMPSAHLKARDSLPLLPSVVRGPDGLLQLGGAQAHDTPLVLDGFNVTDPATGTSSINLPFEAVEGVQVLRDPMAVTHGQLLGGLVELQSRPGGDGFTFGLQGFVPRPRFQNPGAGRLEGIFPRAYVSGAIGSRVHYIAAAEYDFERIPVPGVTQGKGPDLVEKSSTFFARVDAQVSGRDLVTLEGLRFPSESDSFGLSPRREQSATVNLGSEDLFAGLTARHTFASQGTVTVRVGFFDREISGSPNGAGPATMSDAGWQGNWFSAAHRRSHRYNVSTTWERTFATMGGAHDVTVTSDAAVQRLRGTLANQSVLVRDALGRLVRRVDFDASSSALEARDWPAGLAARDVWNLSDRVQLDVGARVDTNGRTGGTSPSARAGVRYALDEDAATVIKAGVGSFMGTVPLTARAYGGHPGRVDRLFDGDTGALVSERTLHPRVGALRLPRAIAATIQVERRIWRAIDAQFGFTRRTSTRLARLDVPTGSGATTVDSTGTSTYHEVQVSMQREWKNSQKLFVSYVRSWSRGELNDFSSLFHQGDAPLVQPGGHTTLSTDVPHRWLVWGTMNLPRRVVLSPVFEWRSGFLYSLVDARQFYAGAPNSRAYPGFMTLDIIGYKTFTVRGRSADFGFQLFNATNHGNPRDVYNVVGAPRMGQFSNSVGPIVRGFMMLKW